MRVCRGLILRLTSMEFGKIEIDGRRVTVGGGANLGRLVTTAVHRGLAGMEMLVGIPGTVGGALHGNTGTHGGDIGEWAASATVITAAGETIERSRDDLVFGYRESSLDEPVILEATLVLEEDDPRELAKRMQKQWIIKRANQPMGHQCAGCIFKNPRGASAGELIEKSGLKGTRIGGAVVSERHANFIVAEPDCTSQDVERLIDLVRSQVERPHGSGPGTGSRNLVSAKEDEIRADRAALVAADGGCCCLARAVRSRWPCWWWRPSPAGPGPSGGMWRNMSRILAITS